MKGGENNLKPFRSVEEARAAGRKGGVRSGEVRRERKTMREMAKAMLYEIGKGSKEPNGVAAVAAMFREAKKGDVSAFRAIAELLGEYDAPSQAVVVSSPIILGTIPPEKVAAAKAAYLARHSQDE